MGQEYILEASGICKAFPGVIALSDVDLRVRKGTVHALMGENGAGKSTMMKILLGIYSRDSGKIIFNGKEVHYKGPREALDDGLAMIHQEPVSYTHLCKIIQIIAFFARPTIGRES